MDDQPSFMGMAILGLFFIIVGILTVFAFIGMNAGMDMPDLLRFRSESYSILMIGLVNIISAIGLVYRAKFMWSVTIVFAVVIILGNVIDVFFTDTAKIAFIIAYVAVVMYLLSKEAKMWYGVG